MMAMMISPIFKILSSHDAQQRLFDGTLKGLKETKRIGTRWAERNVRTKQQKKKGKSIRCLLLQERKINIIVTPG